jgi:sulfide dehydrogenase [flavocytochrome c] flavoprotein subunit
MPKSGFAANSQAKVVAAAIVARFEGREPPPPSWINVCYGLIAPDYGVSVANVYRTENGAIAEIGAGEVDGVSPIHGGPRFRANDRICPGHLRSLGRRQLGRSALALYLLAAGH